MQLRRLTTLALSCGIALGLVTNVLAAGKTVQQQKTASQYRLLLKIGPPEDMSDMGGMGGEMVVGGKAATCRMAGAAMKGSSMHAKVCNHHVELHVYASRTNKVDIRAQVSIVLRDAQKHMTIAVPIMKLMSGSNIKDFHYGNNFYAGAGRYTVQVTVDGVRAAFTAQLR